MSARGVIHLSHLFIRNGQGFAEGVNTSTNKTITKIAYELQDGAGHGGPHFFDPANGTKEIAFLDKYLK